MDKQLSTKVRSLIGIFIMEGEKPNFSAIARHYNVDRHTVAKYYRTNNKIKERKPRRSELDVYRDEIRKRLNITGVTTKAAYFYFRTEKSIKCTYSNFSKYVHKHKMIPEKGKCTPHPFYETAPGEQLQVDWKEDVSICTKSGESIKFNIFAATLGHSRYHVFLYSRNKDETSFKRCLCKTFSLLGGKTKTVYTDNMSAIVSWHGKQRKKHKSIMQFEKDIGIKIVLAGVRSPESKGKVESSNRFVSWLKAYDWEIENEEELKQKIKYLNKAVNNEVNQRTGKIPKLEFYKEREHLSPVTNSELQEGFSKGLESCKVPNTFLIPFRGLKYSVPPKYIGKTVYFKEENGILCIYHKGELIVEHVLAGSSALNYNQDHYQDALMMRHFHHADDVEEKAKENLARLKEIGL